ncbi:hypothetical protein [Burkholderia stagnalis]|uniref:hypothetical protein n=1 Tax=Burkholderia stagnalis TaxID=1503054 RepID=UPI000F56F272|nr:hypothetical protein [Burkholderia stagnalis]
MDNSGVSAGRGGFVVNAAQVKVRAGAHDGRIRSTTVSGGVPDLCGVRAFAHPANWSEFRAGGRFTCEGGRNGRPRGVHRGRTTDGGPGVEIRTRHGAAELAEIRAIHISTVPTGRP